MSTFAHNQLLARKNFRFDLAKFFPKIEFHRNTPIRRQFLELKKMFFSDLEPGLCYRAKQNARKGLGI